MQSPTCLIDDFGPLPLVQPASVADIGDLVRRAAADSHALYPVGGQTTLNLGLPPTCPGIAIDLRQLAQVIDYPARDMTITVQAGITVAQLHETLAAENQRLPLDVPQADRATLGGALAVNASGPRRFGLGTLRDYVIGISAVNDEGHEIKAGGRVVENVAGYDLCKLFIGSLGTLGILTQVTLKVKPLPEEQALVTLACNPDAVGPLLDRLHASRTRPVCLDLLNDAAVRYINQQAGTHLPESVWVVAVGFEDNRDTVSWQVQQLIKEVPARICAGVDAWVGAAAQRLWQALGAFAVLPDARLTFKANLLPRIVADFCRLAAASPEKLLLQAHAGNGIVLGHAAGDLTPERAATMLKPLQEAAAAQGNLILPRCPAAWKKDLPVWGRPRGDLALLRRIKDKLDPRRLFNPGRFVDGL